jgi:hypothetical protein
VTVKPSSTAALVSPPTMFTAALVLGEEMMVEPAPADDCTVMSRPPKSMDS